MGNYYNSVYTKNPEGVCIKKCTMSAFCQQNLWEIRRNDAIYRMEIQNTVRKEYKIYNI